MVPLTFPNNWLADLLPNVFGSVAPYVLDQQGNVLERLPSNLGQITKGLDFLGDVQPSSDQGRTLNLSAGGVLILAHQPVPAGQRIRVVLALPGDDSPIEITGQVGRVRSLSDRVHEVAIEFVEGNIGVQRTLLDYIEERVSGDPEPVGPMSA